MNTKLLTIWAVSASVIAIAALSYIAGKQAGRSAPDARVPSETQGPYTAPGQRGEPQVAYTVPEDFASLPSQWRTTRGAAHDGYAALFDPARREVIVEQCEHPGYLLDDGGRPLMFQGEACELLLWGQIQSLSSDAARVVDRSGRAVDLELALSDDGSTLRLKFDNHDVSLIQGSKNDLMSDLDRHPDIAEQKARYLRAVAGGPRPAETAGAED